MFLTSGSGGSVLGVRSPPLFFHLFSSGEGKLHEQGNPCEVIAIDLVSPSLPSFSEMRPCSYYVPLHERSNNKVVTTPHLRFLVNYVGIHMVIPVIKCQFLLWERGLYVLEV